uniref:Uncharacterized protein n=1 Tax=Anopheles albimanus TaxID=7167 RepID=A0A182FX87_ANOAL
MANERAHTHTHTLSSHHHREGREGTRTAQQTCYQRFRLASTELTSDTSYAMLRAVDATRIVQCRRQCRLQRGFE